MWAIRNRFRTMLLHLLIATFVVSAATQESSCPKKTLAYKGHCYKLFADWQKDFKTFQDAEKECQKLNNGHLFVPNSEEELQAVIKYSHTGKIRPLERTPFIGGIRENVSSPWRWVDGSEGLIKWGPGQPNDNDKGNICIVLLTDAYRLGKKVYFGMRFGFYVDTRCHEKHHYICEFKPAAGEKKVEEKVQKDKVKADSPQPTPKILSPAEVQKIEDELKEREEPKIKNLVITEPEEPRPIPVKHHDEIVNVVPTLPPLTLEKKNEPEVQPATPEDPKEAEKKHHVAICEEEPTFKPLLPEEIHELPAEALKLPELVKAEEAAVKVEKVADVATPKA